MKGDCQGERKETPAVPDIMQCRGSLKKGRFRKKRPFSIDVPLNYELVCRRLQATDPFHSAEFRLHYPSDTFDTAGECRPTAVEAVTQGCSDGTSHFVERPQNQISRAGSH